MSENFGELKESLERMKEVQRIQFDYFKHVTTLSTGTILIMIALLEKVIVDPKITILAIFSIVSFSICLFSSFWVMPVPGNIIQYIASLPIITVVGNKSAEEREIDLENYIDKISSSLKVIGRFSNIARYFFLAGIISLITFAIINLI